MSSTRKKKKWNEAEEEYLAERWGNVSIDSLAHHLQRSKNAVIIRAQRLGLGPFRDNNERGISKHQLFVALGYRSGDSYKKISWIQNRGLPIHRIKCNNSYWEMVYINEFWEWAYKNQSFLDFSKFEKYALGPEPDWVKEKRSSDYRRSLQVKKTPWTSAEDAKLQKVLKEHKYGYRELSKMFQRTEGAIVRRISELNIKDYPIKADNHNRWSQEDYQMLGEFIKDGTSYAVMSDYFARSEKAIRGRVFDMYLTERLDIVRSYIGEGQWGDGRPDIPLRYKKNMSDDDKQMANILTSEFAGLIRAIAKNKSNVEVDFVGYWQKDMCMNWDDVKGCTACEADCDSCTSFRRIPVQYCKRCGRDFFERKENEICSDCRKARIRQAQKKYAVLNSRHKK